jgi:D-arginine dehydrogenase
MRADVAVIGAGIAGASLAAEIAGEASVLILEAEDRPGYHSTGRSAAFWAESYGGPLIQPLTAVSGRFLADPPADFAESSFLSPRGAIHLADAPGRETLLGLEEVFDGLSIALVRMDRAALEARLPGLKPGWDFGLYEPSCADIDVAALHHAYLKRARARGANLVAGARVVRAERSGLWRIATAAGDFAADILVDAAGAWADEVAVAAGAAPLGIRPFRRTIAQVRVEPRVPPDLPLVIEARGRFYFKPEAGGRLWLSPHDETPCDPCDCAPEEVDVATAIERMGEAVDWGVERVEHAWAGLRSFAPDRLPVYGFDPGPPGLFWCAGQGGFGIQTAPAAAKLAAALLLGRTPALDPAPYLASRFTAAR